MQRLSAPGSSVFKRSRCEIQTSQLADPRHCGSGNGCLDGWPRKVCPTVRIQTLPQNGWHPMGARSVGIPGLPVGVDHVQPALYVGAECGQPHQDAQDRTKQSRSHTLTVNQVHQIQKKKYLEQKYRLSANGCNGTRSLFL